MGSPGGSPALTLPRGPFSIRPVSDLGSASPRNALPGLVLVLLSLAFPPLATAGPGAAPDGSWRLPPLPTGRLVAREPLPLATPGGDLVGAAWLEGSAERRLGVRFAAWDGAGWQPPEEVAPPGPGSQLALTGTVREDGTVLLAWSAFDGEDDEVVWSRRERTSWSPPRRLAADNSVPDITPDLHAASGAGSAGDDVLAVWSRYQDGEYRVVLSRFDGRTWSEPRPLGPPGSVFPTFVAGLDAGVKSRGIRILFRTADPRGWQAVEVDAEGRPRRSARVSAETADRPRLAGDGETLRFVWPGPAGDANDVELEPSAHVRSVRWENRP